MKALVSLNGVLSFIDSLSLSPSNRQWLAERLLEGVVAEANTTEDMLNKHCGSWKDSRSAEEIICDLQSSRQSNKHPLNFD